MLKREYLPFIIVGSILLLVGVIGVGISILPQYLASRGQSKISESNGQFTITTQDKTYPATRVKMRVGQEIKEPALEIIPDIRQVSESSSKRLYQVSGLIEAVYDDAIAVENIGPNGETVAFQILVIDVLVPTRDGETLRVRAHTVPSVGIPFSEDNRSYTTLYAEKTAILIDELKSSIGKQVVFTAYEINGEELVNEWNTNTGVCNRACQVLAQHAERFTGNLNNIITAYEGTAPIKASNDLYNVLFTNLVTTIDAL